MIAIDTNVLIRILVNDPKANAGFADGLILSDAQRRQLLLHTFDRKLARLHGAVRVGEEAV